MCAWDKTKPGNVKMRVGRQQILANNAALEDALKRDHNFPGTEGADDGEHLKITLHAPLADDPTEEANKGFLYLKDVSDKAELFFKDEDGHEIQLTTGGTINPAGVMLLAGAQTVTGAKTFQAALTMSGANIVMAGTETVDGRDVSADGVMLDNHESRIDALEAVPGFGAWASKSLNTAYQAATDGFVVCYSDDWDPTLIVYTDGNNPPTTVRTRIGPVESGSLEHSFIMCPVRKGDYWKLSSDKTAKTYVFWLPWGS